MHVADIVLGYTSLKVRAVTCAVMCGYCEIRKPLGGPGPPRGDKLSAWHSPREHWALERWPLSRDSLAFRLRGSWRGYEGRRTHPIIQTKVVLL
jgi:hypothetical protein